MTLNSLKVIVGNNRLYCGISLYKENTCCQDSFVNGGKTPVNNSHLVIDKPESVNLVSPPTIIIDETKTKIMINQKDSKFSILLFMYIYE